MKNIKILVLLLLTSFVSGQVKWMTISEAVEAQKVNKKKIFIDFYADWCASCKKMDATTFTHPVLSGFLNEEYYAVKFDAEGNDQISLFGRTFTNPEYQKGKKKNPLHEFTQYMNVNAVPTLVFLDEKGAPITLLQGAFTAKELEPYLPFIASDEYKKVDTREKWEGYQRKFRSSIRE